MDGACPRFDAAARQSARFRFRAKSQAVERALAKVVLLPVLVCRCWSVRRGLSLARLDWNAWQGLIPSFGWIDLRSMAGGGRRLSGATIRQTKVFGCSVRLAVRRGT